MTKHQSNPSPVKTLDELVGYYEVCNRAEGKSQRTIEWYTANLRRFLQYLKNRHLPSSVDDLSIKLLREYDLTP